MFSIDRNSAPSYAFGPFVLNSSERLLMCGDEIVSLPPKVFDTLLVLVENRGRVLTKNELMDALWPETFVEESSLAQNISLLRKALGQSQSDQVFIQTIPKRGYRFVAEVQESTPDVSAQKPQAFAAMNLESNSSELVPIENIQLSALDHLKKWSVHRTLIAVLCVFGLSAAAVYLWRLQKVHRPHELKSVAVLPFKTVGVEGEAELLRLGLADSVILKLSKLEQTTVLPTSAVFKYIDRTSDAISIGNELAVDAVLDGTVQRFGDRVRVTAQLITLADGKTVWSGKFEEPYRDVFCLQDSVSELLAGDLRLQVLKLRTKTEAKPITQNAEAYQSYLRGFYLWNKRSSEPITKAIEHLEEAVRVDPEFAHAHALLADSFYVYAGTLKNDPDAARNARQSAETAAQKAIQLDETIAEAHTVLAGIMAIRGDGQGAAKEYRRAIALKPNYATAHARYSYFLFAVLDLNGALREAREAQRFDPDSPITNTTLGYMLMMDRKWEESITYSQRALDFNHESIPSRFNLGLAHLRCNRFDEAVKEFQLLSQKDPLASQMGLGLAYARAGRMDEANKIATQVFKAKNRDQVSSLDLAILYSAVGKRDQGFEILKGTTLTWMEKARLKLDPDLDDVRSDPKFVAIVNQQFYPDQNLSAQNSH